MNKEQIAHELALIVVEARLRGFESDNGELGINDYSDQAAEDYRNAFNRIKDQL